MQFLNLGHHIDGVSTGLMERGDSFFRTNSGVRSALCGESSCANELRSLLPMNLLPNAVKGRAGALFKICVGVAVSAFVVPLTWAGEVRYPTKWDWSPLQENEI